VKTIFVSSYLFVRSQTSLDHLVLSSEARRYLTIVNEGTQWKAQVSHLNTVCAWSAVDAQVDGGAFQIQCPCKYKEEYGQPCVHAMALIIHAQLEPNDQRGYDSVFHSQTHAEMYRLPIPSISLLGKLSVEEVLPPEHKVRGGRPKKHRYESTATNPITCRACGGPGHMQQTCPKPRTEVRYSNHREKAMQYARNEAKMYAK
jgi:hypothetical protein